MTRYFPGRRWLAVAVAFPISGVIGGAIGGPVDSVGAALLGGAITGAGISAVQRWAAGRLFGSPEAWVAASAAGYGAGLAAGGALVDYDTDLSSLALMGLVSGAALGLAQGLLLARRGDRRLALAWGAAMPMLFGLGWCASYAIGVNVEDQFTVFGAAGAVLFMVLSGVVLARATSGAGARRLNRRAAGK